MSPPSTASEISSDPGPADLDPVRGARRKWPQQTVASNMMKTRSSSKATGRTLETGETVATGTHVPKDDGGKESQATQEGSTTIEKQYINVPSRTEGKDTYQRSNQRPLSEVIGRAMKTTREELERANFTLTDFMRGQVKECPSTHTPGALASTRNARATDFALANTGDELDMVVYDPSFIQHGVRQLRSHSDNIIIDIKGPGVLLHVGQNHPACTEGGRPDVIRSENDVTEHEGSILSRPASWILDILKKRTALNSDTRNSINLSEILKNKSPPIYSVTSSEQLPVVTREELASAISHQLPVSQPGKASTRGKSGTAKSGKRKSLAIHTGIKTEKTQAPVKERETNMVAPDRVIWENIYDIQIKDGDAKEGADLKPIRRRRLAIGEIKGPDILKSTSDAINLSRVLTSEGEYVRHYAGFKWPNSARQVKGSPSKILIQVHSQMCAANIDYAIVTSYKHTVFLIRDELHKSVVYASEMYDRDQPLLLLYTAFLAMAAGILPDQRPRVPEEELRYNLERVRKEIASKKNQRKWGFLESTLAPAKGTPLAGIPEHE